MKFNAIIALFCVAGLTLVIALAYNIGGTTEETRTMRMSAITRSRLEVERDRLNLCLKTKRDAEGGQINKETITTFLLNTNALLLSENNMFKEQNEKGQVVLQECKKHLETVREDHTGTKDNNVTETIEHLEDDKRRLESAIVVANSTREVSRDKLRRMIKAYQIELTRMRVKLGQKQEERMAKARAARHGGPKINETVVAKTNEVVVKCDPLRPYSIMMDAGSTGSRTHVFEFKMSSDGLLTLVNETFVQLKPGLSSFADNPEGAANSIVPLMEAAMTAVPAAQRSCTAVALKATAGLRLLGEEKSAAILHAVRAKMATYPFIMARDAVEVMDGKDEGPYAWLTVNFLLGNLGSSKKTAAVLDMGGGSTQIVFQPDVAETLINAPADNLYTATVRGAPLKAYQHSYLGLGLKEANKALFAVGAATPDQDFPCLAEGTNVTVGDVVVRNKHQANFDACAVLVAKHLVRVQTSDSECAHKPCAFNGVYQPSLSSTFTGDVYAFSYFYDRMEAYLPKDGKISVEKFREVGRNICGSVDSYAQANRGTMCMDFAFLYVLLHHGYGLDNKRSLFIMKKINGIETAWPLGAALLNQ